MLLPPSLDELIAPNHPVRAVAAILDQIDIGPIVKLHKPGGTSSYNPGMLLKVLVYAYINNVYSSRKIEEAVLQNIHYMWLAGISKPDHNTINRFRGERLQTTLKPIFHQIVLLWCEEGLLNIKDFYTDGTKIEANANRYTFVRGRAIKLSVAASELDDSDPAGFDKVDSKQVEKTIETINADLKNKKVKPAVRQKLNYAQKHWPAALDK